MVGAEAASPQPTVPSAASMRTRMLCACAMVTPAIDIGFFSGSATGMTSTRRIDQRRLLRLLRLGFVFDLRVHSRSLPHLDAAGT